MRRTALDMGFVMQNLAFTSGIALGAVAMGVTQITKNLVNATARMEDYRAQVNTLAKGPQLGGQWMKQIQQFAVKSPLTFEETIRGAELLIGYGEDFGRVIQQNTGLLAVMTKAAVFANVPLEQVVKSLEALKTGRNIRWARLTPLQITPQWVESLGINVNKKGQLEGDPTANFEKIMAGLEQKLGAYHPEELLRTRLTNMEDVMFIFWSSLGDKLKPATSRFLGELQDTLFKIVKTVEDPAVSAALGNAAESIIGPLGDKLIGFIENVGNAIKQDPELIPRWLNSIASGLKNLVAVFAGASAASGIAMALRTIATVGGAGAALGGGPGLVAGLSIGTVVAILGTLGIVAAGTRKKLDDLLPPIENIGPVSKQAIQQAIDKLDEFDTGLDKFGRSAEDANSNVNRSFVAVTESIGGSAEASNKAWDKAWDDFAYDVETNKNSSIGFGEAWRMQLQGILTLLADVTKGFRDMAREAYNASVQKGKALGAERQEGEHDLPGTTGFGGPTGMDWYMEQRRAAHGQYLKDYTSPQAIEQRAQKAWTDTAAADKAAADAKKYRADLTGAGVGVLKDFPHDVAVAMTGMTDKTCAATLGEYLKYLGFKVPDFKNTGQVEQWLKSIGAEKIKAADMGALDIGFAKATGPLGMAAHVGLVTGNEGGVITFKDNQSDARQKGAGYFRYGYRIPTGAIAAGLANFAGGSPYASILADLSSGQAEWQRRLALYRGSPGMKGQQEDYQKWLASQYVDIRTKSPEALAELSTDAVKELHDAFRKSLIPSVEDLAAAFDKARGNFDSIANSILQFNNQLADITQGKYGLAAARAGAMGLDKTADIYSAEGVLASLKAQAEQIGRFEMLYGGELGKTIKPGDFTGLAYQQGLQTQLNQLRLQFGQTEQQGYGMAAGFRDKEGAEDLYKSFMAELDRYLPQADKYLGDAQTLAAGALQTAGFQLSAAASALFSAAGALGAAAGLSAAARQFSNGLQGIGGAGGAIAPSLRNKFLGNMFAPAPGGSSAANNFGALYDAPLGAQGGVFDALIASDCGGPGQPP
jgi:hypothetical protein